MTARAPAVVLFLLSLAFLSTPLSPAQNEPGVAEPKLLSVFPAGGQRGSTVQVEVRGNFLEKTYAAWFESGQFEVRFLKVEEVKNQAEQRSSFFDKKEKLPAFRALLAQKDDDLPVFYAAVRELAGLDRPERDARLGALIR